MQVRKAGNLFVVEGTITTHPRKFNNEHYSRTFRLRSDAELDAIKWTRIEKQLIIDRANERKVRLQIVKEYLEKRKARSPYKQLALGL